MIHLVVANGTLNLLHQITKDWAHGLHHLTRMRAGCAIRFESISLAVRDLKCVLERLREMGSTQWKCADPTATMVGKNHIAGLRSNVKNDNRLVVIGQREIV